MLKASGKGLRAAKEVVEIETQLAQKPQRDNILRQLAKLGNTPYVAAHIELDEEVVRYFIPSSVLATLRRQVIAQLEIEQSVPSAAPKTIVHNKARLTWQPEYQKFPYIYNISNSVAKSFYKRQGLTMIEDAYEVNPQSKLQSTAQHAALIMQCRHCLRYSLGYCVRKGGKKPTWKEPLRLSLADGKMFRLEFKCDECQMNVYADE